MMYLLVLAITLSISCNMVEAKPKKILFSDKFENGLNDWRPSSWWPTDFTANENVLQRDGYIQIDSTHLRTTQTVFNNYVVAPAYEPNFGTVQLNGQDRYVSLKLVMSYSAIPGAGEASYFGVDENDYRLGMGYTVFSNIDLTDLGEFVIAGVGITNDAVYAILIEGFVRDRPVTGEKRLIETYGLHKLCDYKKGTEIEFVGTFDLKDQSVSFSVDGDELLKVSKSEYNKLFPVGSVDLPLADDYPKMPTGVWEIQLMPMLRALPYTAPGDLNGLALTTTNWDTVNYNTTYPTASKYPFGSNLAFGRKASLRLFDLEVSAK